MIQAFQLIQHLAAELASMRRDVLSSRLTPFIASAAVRKEKEPAQQQQEQHNIEDSARKTAGRKRQFVTDPAHFGQKVG